MCFEYQVGILSCCIASVASTTGSIVEPLDIALSISQALILDSQVLGVPDIYDYGDSFPGDDKVLLISLYCIHMSSFS